MIDKIYLLAYLFIILALARVVTTSWRGADAASRGIHLAPDRVWVAVLLVAYFAANLAVAWSGAARGLAGGPQHNHFMPSAAGCRRPRSSPCP